MWHCKSTPRLGSTNGMRGPIVLVILYGTTLQHILAGDAESRDNLLQGIKNSLETTQVTTEKLSTAVISLVDMIGPTEKGRWMNMASNFSEGVNDGLREMKRSLAAIASDLDTLHEERTKTLLQEIKTSHETSQDTTENMSSAVSSLVDMLGPDLKEMKISLAAIAKATKKEEHEKKEWNDDMEEVMRKSQVESRGEFKLRNQEVINPEEAFGLMTLPDTYSNEDPPSKNKTTLVHVLLQPKAITNINSMKKTMGMEIQMSLRWEDQRIEWNGLKVEDMDCWNSVSLSTTILR